MSYQRVPQERYPPPEYSSPYPPPPGYPSAPPPPYEGYPSSPLGYPAYPPPPRPPYEGYQGYFNGGYPPPLPQPPQQYQHYHCEHYQYQDLGTGCFSFLQGCLATLCCCCVLDIFL
ncbi:cysteine-rich and transmembrane domain-containing protein WIH1-like [Tripterygium wilfordii]|uniref:cysteine-rich and transmembrane domain-containing protein WIH1-like n=1 Tax=Tripterygium wilfordii TaxID=458696 RepID=UPI0018F81E4A|nr:cysteine-rich and transmembrane domain-containing protein WIH1-like [Tripterygium wilfordii]